MSVNDLIATGIFKDPERPRDAWSLGTVSGTPAAGVVSVILDGDATATAMLTTVACANTDRVLTLLLGRSRIVTGVIGGPAPAPCPFAVGDIYITESIVAPGTRWTGTTWAAYGAGQVIVGLSAGDADFHEVGHTGGSKDAVLLAHDHLVYHNPAASYRVSTPGADAEAALDGPLYGFNQASTSAGVADTGNQNLPPYIVCYMWKRTA